MKWHDLGGLGGILAANVVAGLLVEFCRAPLLTPEAPQHCVVP